MEQVGYEMYCRLLDEVVKEMTGARVEEELDVQIDLNVTSYIPDELIENSSQKIEVYQNIALCKSEEEILDITDEIVDRYGRITEEVENLLDIARIKILAKSKYIVKISQRNTNIIFYFDASKFNPDKIEELIKIYKNKIKFSPAQEPYITLNIENKDVLSSTKEFLNKI